MVCSKRASALAGDREAGSESDATDAEFEKQPQVWWVCGWITFCVSEKVRGGWGGVFMNRGDTGGTELASTQLHTYTYPHPYQHTQQPYVLFIHTPTRLATVCLINSHINILNHSLPPTPTDQHAQQLSLPAVCQRHGRQSSPTARKRTAVTGILYRKCSASCASTANAPNAHRHMRAVFT